jgi:hypothetical protein
MQAAVRRAMEVRKLCASPVRSKRSIHKGFAGALGESAIQVQGSRVGQRHVAAPFLNAIQCAHSIPQLFL